MSDPATALTDEERDALANAIADDTETAYANPAEGVGDFATCKTVRAVESILAARVRAARAAALRDAAESFRRGKNTSLHWYTVAERLTNRAERLEANE